MFARGGGHNVRLKIRALNSNVSTNLGQKRQWWEMRTVNTDSIWSKIEVAIGELYCVNVRPSATIGSKSLLCRL